MSDTIVGHTNSEHSERANVVRSALARSRNKTGVCEWNEHTIGLVTIEQIRVHGRGT
jgi:hypothetical protein